MKKSLVALAVLASCGLAFAGDNCNKGECTTIGGTTNNGGQGGTGGQGGGGGTGGSGGTGVGIAGAAAGAVANVSNEVKNTAVSTNVNSVSNRNENANIQGQQQGQQQGQKQQQSNSSSNTVGATGSGNSTAVGGQQVTVQGDTVTYHAQERNPVNTAYSAGLTSANGTCMGSTSAGGQSSAFGFTIGTTWTDSDCDRRYDANVLLSLGDREVARELMMQKASVKAAYDRVASGKKPSGASSGKSASATPEQQAALDRLVAKIEQVGVVPAGYENANLADPYIRKLAGLPPLSTASK